MLTTGDLERFVDEYADKAYSYAYGLCNNEPDARELVQAAFVRLFEHAGRYDRARSSLENWYLTLLRHIYVDGVRRWERKSRLSLDFPLGQDGLTVADVVADPREAALLDRLESQESAEQIRAALATLAPAVRAALMLVDVDGLGYEETAQVLDCPLGTVRSRINRGRASLRRKLLEMEVTP
ncbi:MAG TPA: RNA polymerase subunit sigma-24 [Elusimicrobia bacterium]|nr:MAG: hypothetical protein A2X37_05705 [Elusimicrobia bacterium GWA2_66_18]OGR68797.1 MAG: hypothetical protein A2X40_08975 [Elusimicrobia bacterium GWC2_65_9]HAZ09303.1 RNA polymerase subunit sigma-24 [Elusimicrobiota bacterium]